MVSPTGQVRQHTFIGPRTEDTPMLKLAASLEHNIKYENDEIHIDVTVKILVLDMRFQRGFHCVL